jgi:hypothetical protein
VSYASYLNSVVSRYGPASGTGVTSAVLTGLKSWLFGPTCQAGLCERRTECRGASKCLSEAEQQQHLHEAEALRTHEAAECRVAEKRHLREEEVRKRAKQGASARSFWDRTAELGRRSCAEEEAKLTMEQREAQRLRQQQGPRMRM